MLADELNAVLTQTAKAQKIPNFEVKIDWHVLLGDGFVGQIYTGEIHDRTKQKRFEVVIKRTQISDKLYEMVYENEVVFYTKVLKSLGNFRHVPTLYHHSHGNNYGYLVMENLKSQGFKLFPKERYFDRNHLKLIFATYARFHALSFVWKSRDPEQFHQVHHEEYCDLYPKRLEASRNILENSTRAALRHLDSSSPIYQDLLELPQNILPTLMKASQYTGRYSCTVHGDCWSNNLMFRYQESGEPVEVKLIDFQLGRETTPIHDLAYFFYSGASKSDLDCLDDYLHDYHTLLTAILRENGLENEQIFPYQALKTEWKEYGILGLIYGIHFWEIKLTPKSQFTEDMGGVEEGNMDKLLKAIENFGKTVAGEEFKERAVPLLVHGYETGILAKNKIVTEK